MLTRSLNLWRQLPTFLRIVWAALLTGLAPLAAGYFRADAHQSWLGLGLILSGYAAATLDALVRRRHRDRAALFYTGALVSLVIALFIAALVTAIGVPVYLWKGWQHGFSLAATLHLLHFAGLIFVSAAIAGIPNVLRRTPLNAESGPQDSPA